MGIQSDAFLNGEGNAWHHRNKHKKREDEVIPLLMELGIEPYKIIEFGCGDGRRLHFIKQYFPGSRVFGVEPSTDAIFDGRRKYTEVDFVKQSSMYTWRNDERHWYNVVIYGFCLYVSDPHEIAAIVATGDTLLSDNGYLIIHDFDPDKPIRVPYEHEEGLFSYKMDYSKLWLSNPAYSLIKKVKPTEDTAVWVLKKDIDAGWPLETLR